MMARFGIALLGAVMIALAVMANWLGMDPNADWGPYRRTVAVSGALVLGAALAAQLVHVLRHQLDRNRGRARAGLDGADGSRLRIAARMRWRSLTGTSPTEPALFRFLRLTQTKLAESFDRMAKRVRPLASILDQRPGLVHATLFICVVGIYVWIASVGRWRNWPATTNYYDRLAEAFALGQLHLIEQPVPALLALPDPYDPDQRGNVDFVWDASLYRGKYFLYWGPVPALLLVPAKVLFSAHLGDQFLVIASLSGSLLFSTLLIRDLRLYRFSKFPAWLAVPAILMAGLANPLPWLLSRPAVYEAAIAAGQCFLMGGLYFASKAVGNPQLQNRWLALAGLLLTLAFGSRASLMPAATFILLTTSWRVRGRIARDRRTGSSVGALAGAWFLFGSGLVLHGIYNVARFDSALEFGLRYSLTGRNLNDLSEQAFSVAYAFANIFNYSLNPIRTLSVFPFIKPITGADLFAPGYYAAEMVAGILPSFPYSVLAIIPTVSFLSRARWPAAQSSLSAPAYRAEHGDSYVRWITITLLGAVLLETGPLLMVHLSTMRYLADVVPTVVLLSTLGAWECYARASRSRWQFIGFLLVLVSLAASSIVMSLLLSISGYDLRFEKLNPSLFDQLSRLFAW